MFYHSCIQMSMYAVDGAWNAPYLFYISLTYCSNSLILKRLILIKNGQSRGIINDIIYYNFVDHVCYDFVTIA